MSPQPVASIASLRQLSSRSRLATFDRVVDLSSSCQCGSDAEQPLEEVLASTPDGMLTSCAGNDGFTTPPLVLLPG